MKEETKTLTVRLDLKTYAQFAAASYVKHSRTLSGLVFKFVMQTIREAEEEVGADRFSQLVEKETEHILVRSKETKERQGATPTQKDALISDEALFEFFRKHGIPVKRGGKPKLRKSA